PSKGSIGTLYPSQIVQNSELVQNLIGSATSKPSNPKAFERISILLFAFKKVRFSPEIDLNQSTKSFAHQRFQPSANIPLYLTVSRIESESFSQTSRGVFAKSTPNLAARIFSLISGFV